MNYFLTSSKMLRDSGCSLIKYKEYLEIGHSLLLSRHNSCCSLYDKCVPIRNVTTRHLTMVYFSTFNCRIHSVLHLHNNICFRRNPEHYRALLGTDAKKQCWNCGNVVSSNEIFCSSCNYLQPVDRETDFFQLIGVNRSYRTTQAELGKKYRNLQTILHPDKFSSKSKREQEVSEDVSSAVNKAYATLSDPLERGLYLLSLHNQHIEEGTTDIDKEFLMEIMERNEEIENETDPQHLKEFYTNNKVQLDTLISKVEEAFDLEDIQTAKLFLTKMKYYRSIESKIKEIKQKLNIPD